MHSLIQAKACKRCGGDLSIESDVYGVFIECIQCGATWNKNDLKLANLRKSDRDPKTAVIKPLAASPHS